jgi:hypothetical protein
MGVVVTFRTQKKNQQLASELKDLSVTTIREFEELRRHIDELDRIVNLRLERELESTHREFDNVYRTIDSKTDKLAARFENDLNHVSTQINNKLN